MIRASKEQIYDSLDQKRIGQSKINGFIDVNELIQLCKKTDTPVNKKGYMIWEAIEDRELEYLPFTFLKPNMTKVDENKYYLSEVRGGPCNPSYLEDEI